MSTKVLITGVSSGIGLGLAARYLDRGAEVFGFSRRPPQAPLPTEKFHFYSLDLLQVDHIGPGLTQLLSGVTAIDQVILNAGVLGQIADLGDTSVDSMKSIMDVNVWANKHVLDSLMSSGVAIRNVIAISSGAAVNGNRGWGGYSISKAALNMLIRLYSREQPEVHFSAVAPGLVDTAMQDYLTQIEPDPRFPSLEVLKEKRGTTDMPGPDTAAQRLIDVFDRIESVVESGGFIDIRNLPPAAKD